MQKLLTTSGQGYFEGLNLPEKEKKKKCQNLLNLLQPELMCSHTL